MKESHLMQTKKSVEKPIEQNQNLNEKNCDDAQLSSQSGKYILLNSLFYSMVLLIQMLLGNYCLFLKYL